MAKEKYYKNRIFIAELQEGCYGSVSEQIRSFEEMMPHYFKSELVLDKIDAMDAIIVSRKEQNESAFQYFLAVTGFVITAVLSLPAIRETLEIIRNSVITLMPSDVPVLSLDNASLFLWFVVITYIGVKLREYLKKIRKPKPKRK